MTTDPFPEGWPYWVREQTAVEGDCLIWQGLYDGPARYPYSISPVTGQRVGVKAFLMAERGGGRVNRYATSCHNGRCIAPEHQQWKFAPDWVRP
ncbi:hypothetical protein AB0F73_13630 [Micromonospora purpureochromogenes]|uniref:hypothetical protein n=1 Tax=Micromonospora purpureochromogenes TaxID=47872 RepID=UPI0033E056C7